MTKFDEIYQDIIRKIMTEGIEELNVRTGKKTKALPGVSFSIDLEQDGLPVLTLRKNPLKSPIAETLWFISGSKKPADFVQKFTKMWDPFIESDGTLAAAYGWRWRHAFGRDQLDSLVRLLTEDSSSRHGVVVTWDPREDGYGGIPKKNVPCPYTFTVNIIGGRLHLHNILRSEDMILGGPFDTFGFSLLACILAQKLGVRPVIYTHAISNAHIYENHYDGANEIISRTNNHEKIVLALPENVYDRAEKFDESLVPEILEPLMAQYHPLAPIENLTIAL